MSFSITTPQFRDGSKDVTRRLGWWNLKAGDHFMAVEKAMGLKPGQKVKRLGECVVVVAHKDRLDDIEFRPTDLKREGFPDLAWWQFVDMFCRFHRHKKCTPRTYVNRIVFRRVK